MELGLGFVAWGVALKLKEKNELVVTLYKKRVRPAIAAGRADVQHRTAVAQSMGLPSCFIFSIRAFICSFFLSVSSSML